MSRETILIVEDEAITGMGLKKSLTDMGYVVIDIVPTGEQAVEVAIEQKPNLVLMDIQLAGKMDGIEAAENIRVRTRIPVIYLTAYSDDRFVQKAKITEPFAYLLKPVREQELKTAIEMAIYKHQIEQQIRQRDDTIHTLLNATDNPSLLLDAQANIIALNEAMVKRTQDKKEHIIGKPFFELLTRHVITAPLAEAVRQAGTGKTVRVEENFGNVWYDCAVIPIADSQGIIQSIAVHCTDISHRKADEITLKSLNDQLVAERIRLATLDAALDSMDDPVIITDSAGIISYVNGSFKTRFGYTLQDVEGKHFSTLSAPENKFSVNVDGFVLDQKSIRTGNFIARNKYGLNLSFLLKSSPLSEQNRMRYRVIVLRERLT